MSCNKKARHRCHVKENDFARYILKGNHDFVDSFQIGAQHENMCHMLQYCEENVLLANTLNARFAPYYSEVKKNSICFGMNALTSMFFHCRGVLPPIGVHLMLSLGLFSTMH
jgi:hypothetical protein